MKGRAVENRLHGAFLLLWQVCVETDKKITGLLESYLLKMTKNGGKQLDSTSFSVL